MKAYPVEYRRRVVELHGQGWTTREIQDALGVSRAWVDSIKRLHAAGRPLDVKSRANKRTSLATRQGDRLKARVAEYPGATLADLKRDLGLTESVWSIWRAVRALGLSLKKSRSSPLSGTGRTSPGPGPSGRSSAPASTRAASSSSTRRSARPR
jgi:transposase